MKEYLGYFLIYLAMEGETWNFSGTYSIRRINRHRCVSYIGGG